MNVKQMSMIEIAEHLISKRKGPVDFEKLAQDVATLKGETFEEFKKVIGTFYTDLTASGRFVMVEGKWDLKERQLFAAGEVEFSIQGYEGIYEGESDDTEKDAYDLDLLEEETDEDEEEIKDEIDEVVNDEEEADNNDGDISESETTSKYDETEKYNEYDDDSFYE